LPFTVDLIKYAAENLDKVQTRVTFAKKRVQHQYEETKQSVETRIKQTKKQARKIIKQTKSNRVVVSFIAHADNLKERSFELAEQVQHTLKPVNEALEAMGVNNYARIAFRFIDQTGRPIADRLLDIFALREYFQSPLTLSQWEEESGDDEETSDGEGDADADADAEHENSQDEVNNSLGDDYELEQTLNQSQNFEE